MTTYSPEVDAHGRHVNLWLVAVILLGAGLFALGAWTLADRYTGSGNEAEQIVDDLNAAVNAGNAEDVRALFAADAVFEMPTGDQVTGADDVVNAALIPHSVGFRLARVAPVTSVGELAATFVEYRNGTQAVELVVLQLEDGKIVRQWVYDQG